jgi:hypothetical protein
MHQFLLNELYSAGSGTAIVASERLDFAPQVGDVELADLTAYLERVGQKG